jgi:hypothetical protein
MEISHKLRAGQIDPITTATHDIRAWNDTRRYTVVPMYLWGGLTVMDATMAEEGRLEYFTSDRISFA